jgi:hypothetical protein
MNTNFTIRTLSIISTCMLVIALGHLPYGYYILLKMAVCATFVTLALRLNERGNAAWTIAAWAFVALYNPIVRIPFHKDAWSTINMATIVVLWLGYRKATRAETTTD